jgi:hypothetical protein
MLLGLKFKILISSEAGAVDASELNFKVSVSSLVIRKSAESFGSALYA